MHALVSLEDYDRVSAIKWSIAFNGHNFYAVNKAGGKATYLHRFILNAPKGLHVDHRDGNGLNCTRQNLRFATPAQNSRNSKKRETENPYKGIRRADAGGWCARIKFDKKTRWLGRFDTAEEAARAYDAAARKHFGEFARLNFQEAAA